VVDGDKCIQCMECERICPMDVKIINSSLRRGKATAETGDCIKCGLCVDICPKNAIDMNFRYG